MEHKLKHLLRPLDSHTQNVKNETCAARARTRTHCLNARCVAGRQHDSPSGAMCKSGSAMQASASSASPIAENEAKLIESGFSILEVNHSSASMADSLVTVSTSLSVTQRLQLGSTTDLVSGWSVRLE